MNTKLSLLFLVFVTSLLAQEPLSPTESAHRVAIEEYLSSNSYCFIEWPEKIGDFLPSSYLKISISNQEDSQKRHIKLEKIG